MPSKILKEIVNDTRSDPSQRVLDLKEKLSKSHKQFYADLVWLDQELWTLPHIQEIDLSASHQIDAKSAERIIHIV